MKAIFLLCNKLKRNIFHAFIKDKPQFKLIVSTLKIQPNRCQIPNHQIRIIASRRGLIEIILFPLCSSTGPALYAPATITNFPLHQLNFTIYHFALYSHIGEVIETLFLFKLIILITKFIYYCTMLCLYLSLIVLFL